MRVYEGRNSWNLLTIKTKARIHIYKILLWCQVFGQEFYVSAEVCDSRNWNSRSNIASFERRLRGAAPTPLTLPCPFRTSTCTQTDAERDKREVAKIPHVEEEFRNFWLKLNGCNAWMMYKIGIISKRYLIMFGIFCGGILSSVRFFAVLFY